MAPNRAGFLLVPAVFLAAGAAAAPPSQTGVIVFSNLCASGKSFSGSRLTLKSGPEGDSGDYRWGDTAAATAPLSQLATAPDGKVTFRYMPDADNPEVYVRVTGIMAGDAFSGEADGKPLNIPRLRDPGTAIPACRN